MSRFWIVSLRVFLVGCPVVLFAVYWMLLVWQMKPFRGFSPEKNPDRSIRVADLFSLTVLIGCLFVFLGFIFKLALNGGLGTLLLALIMIVALVGWIWFRTCRWLSSNSISDSSRRICFSCLAFPSLIIQMILILYGLICIIPQAIFYFQVLDWQFHEWGFSNLFKDWEWTWETRLRGVAGLAIVGVLALMTRRLNRWIVVPSVDKGTGRPEFSASVVEPWES